MKTQIVNFYRMTNSANTDVNNNNNNKFAAATTTTTTKTLEEDGDININGTGSSSSSKRKLDDLLDDDIDDDLECSFCKKAFSDIVKVLPCCGNSICGNCEQILAEHVRCNGNNFVCAVCNQNSSIPTTGSNGTGGGSGLVTNNLIISLIAKKSKKQKQQLSQPQQPQETSVVEEMQMRRERLRNMSLDTAQTIRTHCDQLRNEINFTADILIDRINRARVVLQETVNIHEVSLLHSAALKSQQMQQTWVVIDAKLDELMSEVNANNIEPPLLNYMMDKLSTKLIDKIMDNNYLSFKSTALLNDSNSNSNGTTSDPVGQLEYSTSSSTAIDYNCNPIKDKIITKFLTLDNNDINYKRHNHQPFIRLGEKLMIYINNKFSICIHDLEKKKKTILSQYKTSSMIVLGKNLLAFNNLRSSTACIVIYDHSTFREVKRMNYEKSTCLYNIVQINEENIACLTPESTLLINIINGKVFEIQSKSNKNNLQAPHRLDLMSNGNLAISYKNNFCMHHPCTGKLLRTFATGGDYMLDRMMDLNNHKELVGIAERYVLIYDLTTGKLGAKFKEDYPVIWVRKNEQIMDDSASFECYHMNEDEHLLYAVYSKQNNNWTMGELMKVINQS